ncbi:MAG: cohesin domain-containing protein, partial [Bacteroidota bacterium]
TTQLFGQSVPSYVPTSGLVGWWGFNGNAQDGSGNGNHGTVNGATLTSDRFGNQNGAYLSNSSSTNSITGSCSNLPSGNNPRTISIWYNATQEITNLYNSQSDISIPTLTSCLGDTVSVTISHPALTGVANASLRMTYNPDSLTYVGFNSLNPAFSGMTISGGNGVVLMNWGVTTNQTIAAGNMVNLRFRVNGSSPVAWDTLTSCEFSDENLYLVPQAFASGSITQNTRSFTWNRNICEGQSFSLSGQLYTNSGTYQGRRFGTGGACDTL